MDIDVKRIKGIIFDYGGTLDTGGDHWSVVIRRAYDEAGVAVDEAAFREAYVYAERELARTRHILPEHDFHDLLLIKMRLELEWLSMNGRFAPAQVEAKAAEIARLCYESARASVARAIPVLENLSKRYPLVLVSNFYGNISTVLKDFGVDRFFPHIIESSVVGVRKPDPEIFRLGVRELHCTSGEVLVVGDSYSKDIEPALSIGCQAIWIKGKGWTDAEDARVYPDTITDITRLTSILAPAEE